MELAATLSQELARSVGDLAFAMFSTFKQEKTKRGMKLKLGGGTLLCSNAYHYSHGRNCLVTLAEDAMDSPMFGKFRWVIDKQSSPSETFTISNMGFEGKLCVSKYFFNSNGRRITGVHVRRINDEDISDRRHLWFLEKREHNVVRLVSAFNGQVLCQSIQEANYKGDHWVGVAHDEEVKGDDDDDESTGKEFVRRESVDEQLLDESAVGVEPVTKESGNGDVVCECLTNVDAQCCDGEADGVRGELGDKMEIDQYALADVVFLSKL